jgi:mono/diheme cytochrome c family protein
MSRFVLAAGGNGTKGKAIYDAKCVTCHGPQGKGDGPLAKALKPPPANLTSKVSKQKSEDEILKTIENGIPKTAMVAWKGQLTEAEIQDVLAYVLTLRK